MFFLRFILVATLAIALPASANAKPTSGIERYKVRKGDSLELLAAEYYGNRVHKIYLMVENGMDHQRPLKPGERLRIPVSATITTAAGDTLGGLAESYLGSSNRAKYLAEFNGLDVETTLALGQELIVPLRVRYRAKGDENLRDIALGLFADASLAELLRDYNDLEGDTLAAGQLISVPVPKIKVQASKRRPPSADEDARASKRTDMMRRAALALPIAKSAWRAGGFATVKRELTRLELDYLDASFATDAGILLGSVYVAYDDVDSALAAFTKVLSRAPGLVLDEKIHSPKVRAVWNRAKEAPP
ncbi:MAG: LysM peptidoglycan-binding domain-containing protein [Myxococcales bacterium]|nr:LysM peptidoglycan-binding domain-containing protein [Myxococcales bacterium]